MHREQNKKVQHTSSGRVPEENGEEAVLKENGKGEWLIGKEKE